MTNQIRASNTCTTARPFLLSRGAACCLKRPPGLIRRPLDGKGLDTTLMSLRNQKHMKT